MPESEVFLCGCLVELKGLESAAVKPASVVLLGLLLGLRLHPLASCDQTS